MSLNRAVQTRPLSQVVGLEFLTDILLRRGAVTDVRAVFVLQATKLLDELLFKLAFWRSHCGPGVVFSRQFERSLPQGVNKGEFRAPPLVIAPSSHPTWLCPL